MVIKLRKRRIRSKPLSANEQQRLVELSWLILEHRILYEELPADRRFNKYRISDTKYDKLVNEYEALCKRNKCKPSASKKIKIYDDGGSGTLALGKLLLRAYRDGMLEKEKHA